MSNQDWLSRTHLLLGTDKINRLKNSHVLIVGVGGVGAYAAEQVCRAGVGAISLVDGDTVHPSNRNRQLLALLTTEGMNKTQVMGDRLLDINPELHLTTIQQYAKDESIQNILEKPYDFVIDAIDSLGPKVHLIHECVKRNMRLVSSMGAGGKIDPLQVKVSDISKSYNCRLAYYIRKRLHRMGIHSGFPVVYSPEPVNPEAIIATDDIPNKKSLVGTISYLPAIFGCYCASVAIRGIITENDPE